MTPSDEVGHDPVPTAPLPDQEQERSETGRADGWSNFRFQGIHVRQTSVPVVWIDGAFFYPAPWSFPDPNPFPCFRSLFRKAPR